jgi:hypothetical protein
VYFWILVFGVGFDDFVVDVGYLCLVAVDIVDIAVAGLDLRFSVADDFG